MEELNTDDLQSFSVELLKRAKVEKETREFEQKKKEDELSNAMEKLKYMKEKNRKLSEILDTYKNHPVFSETNPVNWRPLGIEQVAKHFGVIEGFLYKNVNFIKDNENPTRRITATTIPIKMVETYALTECVASYKRAFNSLMSVIDEIRFEQSKKNKKSTTPKKPSLNRKKKSVKD